MSVAKITAFINVLCYVYLSHRSVSYFRYTNNQILKITSRIWNTKRDYVTGCNLLKPFKL
jgi:hypothetical protein